MTTRGERNFNPGNIRHGSSWVGLAATQNDPSFCTFISPEYGIRAIAMILASYKAKGIDTLRATVNRWAPPSENETDAYVHDVSSQTGLDPDTCIDLTAFTTCKALVKAIIYHENGEQPYSDETITKGLSLAGIQP
jgi:hypothetical protein